MPATTVNPLLLPLLAWALVALAAAAVWWLERR